ncbi:hypothetical protein [Planktothrix paucivesiculata]|uniref:Uncharacterized protein n=1 Tax=Planktothrix paucivesiculata PCC 9631 TaxID=671071 RepID=A0A7Z9BFX7_9CYAN|nr:hypothetical protein [Planktothrix paucivesiculata]VXD11793.1 conserved hypothetical protein [Planktothrix paucivesiculata PCC 9631]
MIESLTQKQYRSVTKVSVSMFIISVIFVQFSVAFFGICPKKSSSFSLKSLCPRLPKDPAFYPFLNYPMYARARYEGIKVRQHLLFGVLEDGTEIPITDQELQVSRYLFIEEILPKVLEKDLPFLKEYVKIYEQKHQKKLVKLRLENHPLAITREGVNPVEKTVIVDLML